MGEKQREGREKHENGQRAKGGVERERKRVSEGEIKTEKAE